MPSPFRSLCPTRGIDISQLTAKVTTQGRQGKQHTHTHTQTGTQAHTQTDRHTDTVCCMCLVVGGAKECEDLLSQRLIQEVFHWWSLAGGDLEAELRRNGVINLQPPICRLPRYGGRGRV